MTVAATASRLDRCSGACWVAAGLVFHSDVSEDIRPRCRSTPSSCRLFGLTCPCCATVRRSCLRGRIDGCRRRA